MCDLTIINPTKNPFTTGTGINQACGVYIKEGVYISVGQGTVMNFISSELNASGSYSFLGNKGTWSIAVTANNDGTWNLSAEFTGPGSPYSTSFTANCSQTGSNPNQLTFTDVNSDLNVVLTQDDGSVFTDGKIEIQPSTAPIAVYLDSNVS